MTRAQPTQRCAGCTHNCAQGHRCESSRKASLQALAQFGRMLLVAAGVAALIVAVAVGMTGCATAPASDLLAIGRDALSEPALLVACGVIVMLLGVAAGWSARGAVERAPYTLLDAESHPDTAVALAQMPGSLDGLAARTDALLYGTTHAPRRRLRDMLRHLWSRA